MAHEPINVESLERAIAVWTIMLDCYKQNMANIKSNNRFTWWLRPVYWRNERAFHKSFTGLIKRRIQLQTALKERNNER